MRGLAQLKNRKYVGVRQFAHEVETILREMGSAQERGNVSDYPNERTVRFYLSEGLLSQPEEKKGSALIFNYSHLLTLLAIKKLQAQGIPNGFIRSLVVGKPDRELEIILREEIKTVTDPDEIVSYARMTQSELNKEFGEEVILKSVLPQMEEELEPGEIMQSRAKDEEELEDKSSSNTANSGRTNKAADYLRGLMRGPGHEASAEVPATPQLPLFSVSRAIPDATHIPKQNWTRYEIVCGLEVHVCRDVLGGSNPPIDRRVLLKIAEILGLTELIRGR